ncbi:MAG: ATP-binding protein [Acidobacteria bacterium]|nr:MAG: ATP-binding protein [Acidobacteriota bacterium]
MSLNARLKFTREGGRVLVRVSQEAGQVSIEVRDTGTGCRRKWRGARSSASFVPIPPARPRRRVQAWG